MASQLIKSVFALLWLHYWSCFIALNVLFWLLALWFAKLTQLNSRQNLSLFNCLIILFSILNLSLLLFQLDWYQVISHHLKIFRSLALVFLMIKVKLYQRKCLHLLLRFEMTHNFFDNPHLNLVVTQQRHLVMVQLLPPYLWIFHHQLLCYPIKFDPSSLLFQSMIVSFFEIDSIFTEFYSLLSSVWAT